MGEKLILRVPIEALVECLMNAPQEAQMELLSAFVESDSPELRVLVETLKVLWASLEPDEEEPFIKRRAVAELPGETLGAFNSGFPVPIAIRAQELVEAIERLSVGHRDELVKRVVEVTDELVVSVADEEIHTMRKDAALARFGQALEAIWKANAGFTEEEVKADVDAAITEVRAERRASGRN